MALSTAFERLARSVSIAAMTGRPLVRVVADSARLREGVVTSLREAGYSAEASTFAGLVTADPAAGLVVVYPSSDDPRQATAAVAQLRTSSSLPIIVIAPQQSLAGRLAAFDAGADDVIAHACEPEELVARFKVWARRGSLPTQRWTIGDLTVDATNGTATRGGHYVHLPPISFNLLVAMAKRQGQPVSKNDLRREVWGDTHVSDNVIDVRISMLRRQLEQHGPQLVRTVYGRGYRLIE